MSKTFNIFLGLLATTASAVGQVPLKLYEGQPHPITVSSNEDLDYTWKSYLVTDTPFTIDNNTPTSEEGLVEIADANAASTDVVFNEEGTYILKVDGYRKDDACMNSKAMAVQVQANNFFAYFDPTVGGECVAMGMENQINASIRFADRTASGAEDLASVDGFFPIEVKASYRVKLANNQVFEEWVNIDNLPVYNQANEVFSFVVDPMYDLNNGAEIQLRLDEAKNNLQFALNTNNNADSEDLETQDAVFNFQYFALPITPNFELALSRK